MTLTERFVTYHRFTVLEWAKNKIIEDFIYFIFYIPVGDCNKIQIA